MHNSNFDNYKKFMDRNGVNLDITNKCSLECPRCPRETRFNNDKKALHAHGHDMPWDTFEKVLDKFHKLNFCGQLSDPVHHPKFIEMLERCNELNKRVTVHVASTGKSKAWFIKAFKACPDAKWWFGIDGYPSESHKYRIHQKGEKLFDIMKESVNHLTRTPRWQYIVFDYNVDHIDDCKKMAAEIGVEFNMLESSRWKEDDEYKPKNSDLAIKRKKSFDTPELKKLLKLDPKCIKDSNPKQFGIDNQGNLLPCCWIDTKKTAKTDEYKKLMKVSKIKDYDTIDDILYTPEWADFFDSVMNHKGLLACSSNCSRRDLIFGEDKKENDTFTYTITSPNGKIKIVNN